VIVGEVVIVGTEESSVIASEARQSRRLLGVGLVFRYGLSF
jgi:hypothetical protein